MKIHFIGDLNGSKNDYKKIIDLVKSRGYELVTEHFLERDMTQLQSESEEEAELYARKMKQWIQKADIILVEVTHPGLGSGYEIATALFANKPVIAIYRRSDSNVPHVLKGIQSDRLQVCTYNDDTLQDTLTTALDFAQETADVRFNFFISPSIGNYLDWISKEKKIPRSVYLRNLIEHDMNESDEYNA